MKRLIFHIDVNSAFLSWESARRVKNGEDDLRLIPSIIGGNPKSRRGVVLAKSIPAKQFHIKTDEPIGMALRKCPSLMIAPATKGLPSGYGPPISGRNVVSLFGVLSLTKALNNDPL